RGLPGCGRRPGSAVWVSGGEGALDGSGAADGPRRGREAFSLHVPRNPPSGVFLLLYLREKASRTRRGLAPVGVGSARGFALLGWRGVPLKERAMRAKPRDDDQRTERSDLAGIRAHPRVKKRP